MQHRLLEIGSLSLSLSHTRTISFYHDLSLSSFLFANFGLFFLSFCSSLPGILESLSCQHTLCLTSYLYCLSYFFCLSLSSFSLSSFYSISLSLSLSLNSVKLFFVVHSRVHPPSLHLLLASVRSNFHAVLISRTKYPASNAYFYHSQLCSQHIKKKIF